MSRYGHGGLFNPAYHQSDTLEVDRRNALQQQHGVGNPYARTAAPPETVHPPWGGWSQREGGLPMGPLTVSAHPESPAAPHWGHRDGLPIGPVSTSAHPPESPAPHWGHRDGLPMGPVSTSAHPESPAPHWGAHRDGLPMGPLTISAHPERPARLQHDRSHSTFQMDRAAPPYHAASGNMTMRWRGMAMRRMSMFPEGDPAHQVFTENAIRSEMENEEQNLVKDLVAMSTRDRIRAIRDLPMTFEEKKHIRSQVLTFKSTKRSRMQLTCLTDCSENVSLSLRRCHSNVTLARQTLELWQGTMKEIGGKFGTGVLSYFLFLKWLLMFNVFSFLVNFGFITIPLVAYDSTTSDLPPNPNVSFRGLEILTGAGYFNYSAMYYGGYSNATIPGRLDYNMQLAYFFTIAAYMVLCGAALIYSMASSFQRNYVLADASGGAWQLLCSWDFSVTNERAVRQRKNNLLVQLKESLAEKNLEETLTVSEKLKHLGLHLGTWLFSTSLSVGCGAGIYYLNQYEQQKTTDVTNWTLLQEAETLLVPFVVSLINLVIPLFYSLLNKVEHYSNQRTQIYALIVRNVILKMSILGILCYYWMHEVPNKFSCWESVVGQALYRLVIVDFLFLMLGSFFGEFLSNVIGTRCLPSLGVPEFDVARNVLDLIYAQTLAWIGIYFAPLLPVMQILKFFILFYLKKVSLIQNCQPPRRSNRAAQMQTIFIGLLFLPSFVGALSMVAYTVWSLTPSERCGPFRGLNSTIGAVSVWMSDLEGLPGSHWPIWIYYNVVRSEIFYFLLTLIVIVIMYIFWQLTQGRKLLIALLKQQIVNEGKDKSFLLERLQDLQKHQPKKKKNNKLKNHKKNTKRCPGDARPSVGRSSSNVTLQTLLAAQRPDEEERGSGVGVAPAGGVPSYISTASGALAMAMRARQGADNDDDEYDGAVHRTRLPSEQRGLSSSSSVSASTAVALALQARQREEEEGHYRTTPSGDNTRSDRPGSVLLAMEAARHRAEEGGGYRPRTADSSADGAVMQARQRAPQHREEDSVFRVPAAPQSQDHGVFRVPSPPQDPAPSSAGSSALIQAMLARQEAQNEYDDGY